MAHTLAFLKNKINPYSTVDTFERPWMSDSQESSMDDPARDPRAERLLHDFTEKDFQGHRAMFQTGAGPGVLAGGSGGGVAGGLASSGPHHHHHHHRPHHRPHHRRHHRHHHRAANGASSQEQRPMTPPAQRVQFILGEEDAGGSNIEPHPLFSEMETLTEVEGELEWKETARWVRFEEDVEEGGNRWSKPHVGTLSLHSLFELRSLLLNGSIMLDMEAACLDDIADLIGDNLANCGALAHERRGQLRDILLRKHKHLHGSKSRRGREECSSSSSVARLPLIRSLAEIGRSYSAAKGAANSGESGAAGGNNGTAMVDIQTSPSGVSLPDTNGHANGSGACEFAKRNLHFMRKLPPGSESSNILIGEVDFVERPVAVFVRLAHASLLGDLTEVPVPTRFIFLLLGPVGGISRYHEIGRAMATLLSDEVFHIVAYKARNRTHLMAATDEFLDAVTVLPPGEWDPNIRIEPPAAVPSQDQRKRPNKDDHDETDAEAVCIAEEKYREESGLVRTGRLFGGLVNDFHRKRVWYWSDFKDAMAVQSVAAFIFLYFACLTPIVTFGGLLSDATHHRMGTIESLVSGLICGVVYGFFSGQPLTILGSTGPVLVFETILFSVCTSNGLEYLPFRLWVGLWISVMLIVLVALDASAYVCYITRFTEENFATLIAFIFIVKACEKVYHIGHSLSVTALLGDCRCVPAVNDHIVESDISSISANYTSASTAEQCLFEVNGSLAGSECPPTQTVINGYLSHERFLMSLLIFLLTFLISITLKNFKLSSFFPTKVRTLISDFGVIIAIAVMTAVDCVAGINTPKLQLPGAFTPTWHGRGWLISPFGHSNPWWTAVAAALPALLGVILIFMDQQITAVIVNRKEHKLKKGGGYHLDLFVLALLIGVNSVLGLPWFVAATVLAINHVNSLKVESECAAPGEKPRFLGVRENRLTHVLIFATIGLSVLMTPLLRLIPMPVLFGVFLYMGVSALKGLQFFDRILIMLMPVKYQPDYSFLRQVPLKRVHLFTLIQLVCLIALWVIKSISYTSILFPIMLVVMVAIRKLLERVFTARELNILDDTMPEFSKKKSEHKQDENAEEPVGGENVDRLPTNESGNITIPLASGNVMRIPRGSINISEELNRSGIWLDIQSSKAKESRGICSHVGSSPDDSGHKKRRRKKPHCGAAGGGVMAVVTASSDGSDTGRSAGAGGDIRLSVMHEEEADEDDEPECHLGRDVDNGAITIKVSCPSDYNVGSAASRVGENQV